MTVTATQAITVMDKTKGAAPTVNTEKTTKAAPIISARATDNLSSPASVSEENAKLATDISDKFKGYVDVEIKGDYVVLTANSKKPEGLWKKLTQNPNSIREMSNIKSKLGLKDKVIASYNPQIEDFPANDYEGHFDLNSRYIPEGKSIKIPKRLINTK